jgi:hypothetical protein
MLVADLSLDRQEHASDAPVYGLILITFKNLLDSTIRPAVAYPCER